MPWRLPAIALLALAIAAGLVLLLGDGEPSGEERSQRLIATAAEAAEGEGALGWDPAREGELTRRAATGTSHVIYANSPGGVIASAERTDAWRAKVEDAAADHDVDPDRLEALVFLESAGRAGVIAGTTPEAASGLTQITPSAATELLDMRVDLERSVELTRDIARAERAGGSERASRLARRRATIDERFDPERALDGAARYLALARKRFGADDLATVSYHMGIGNLESVIRAYAGAGKEAIGDVVETEGLSYAQLYFDSAPDRNPRAHEILSGLGDDSSEYFWKILASEEIMELWRGDREQLERTAELATAKATLEELYHPEEETEVFESPDDVEEAIGGGRLLPLPAAGEGGWRLDPRMGELAPRLDRDPSLYRALRPEALAILSYMSARVRELSGAARPLRVTSAVRDSSYQELLAAGNPEATHTYSLHTTGFAFDVLREYEDGDQAAAFQFMLDRLQALAMIDYAVEPRAIHVTVSDLGAELVAP